MKNIWIKIISIPILIFMHIKIKFIAWKVRKWPDKHGYSDAYLLKNINYYVAQIMVYSKYDFKMLNREKIVNLKNAVIVTNHQTNWDPLVLQNFFPQLNGWFAKKELFDSWKTEHIVYTARAFPLERGNPQQTAVQFFKASREFRKGRNLAVFPEGTRSGTNKMNSFDERVFKFIKSIKADIQPIKLDYKVDYKNDDGTKNAEFVMKVLDVIKYDSYKDKCVSQITNETQELIKNA